MRSELASFLEQPFTNIALVAFLVWSRHDNDEVFICSVRSRGHRNRFPDALQLNHFRGHFRFVEPIIGNDHLVCVVIRLFLFCHQKLLVGLLHIFLDHLEQSFLVSRIAFSFYVRFLILHRVRGFEKLNQLGLDLLCSRLQLIKFIELYETILTDTGVSYYIVCYDGLGERS